MQNASLAAPLALNPKLAAAAFAEEFRAKGRVQIRDLLTDASARTLLHKLQNETPWTVTFNEGERECEVEQYDPNLRVRLTYAAWERARTSFQYIYDRHALSWNRERNPELDLYYSGVVEFLNAPEFLNLMRKTTGLEEIAWTDGQATVYRPGDFLTAHDDDSKIAKRLVAYVLNMTPVWRTDLGGVLEFIDDKGNIAEGYVPAFNVLNIFRVPARHAVTTVTPFGGLRYAITGWLHAA
jgi:Rps23 Pro-64 3,4-dihydroxylase Tpa1-like proline 4-hydroxylase